MVWEVMKGEPCMERRGKKCNSTQRVNRLEEREQPIEVQSKIDREESDAVKVEMGNRGNREEIIESRSVLRGL